MDISVDVREQSKNKEPRQKEQVERLEKFFINVLDNGKFVGVSSFSIATKNGDAFTHETDVVERKNYKETVLTALKNNSSEEYLKDEIKTLMVSLNEVQIYTFAADFVSGDSSFAKWEENVLKDINAGINFNEVMEIVKSRQIEKQMVGKTEKPTVMLSLVR